MCKSFWLEDLKEIDDLENLGVGERIILKWGLNVCLGVDCVNLSLTRH